jgi:hypothetical protein
MKKAVAWAAALLLPAGILFHVFMSVSHFTVDQRISRAEFLQDRLIERNKRRLAEESILLSPQRVRAVATGEFGWSRPEQDRMVHFWVEDHGDEASVAGQGEVFGGSDD